jgi:hypothetical protein
MMSKNYSANEGVGSVFPRPTPRNSFTHRWSQPGMRVEGLKTGF